MKPANRTIWTDKEKLKKRWDSDTSPSEFKTSRRCLIYMAVVWDFRKLSGLTMTTAVWESFIFIFPRVNIWNYVWEGRENRLLTTRRLLGSGISALRWKIWSNPKRKWRVAAWFSIPKSLSLGTTTWPCFSLIRTATNRKWSRPNRIRRIRSLRNPGKDKKDWLFSIQFLGKTPWFSKLTFKTLKMEKSDQ